MTTPNPSLEDRVTILETRLDTVLPTLATKEDIARLDGKIDAVEGRLNGKIDAAEERLNGKIDAAEERLNGKIDKLDAKIDATSNRLLIRFSAVGFAMLSIAVAVVKYL